MATTLRNKIGDAADFGHLREAAIRLFELLTGQVYTDYNTHDPGVTILEACLYALTETGQKADQPIQSLLQNSSSSFVTTPLSFYNRPVTMSDLRKLLIDRIGVSNSWFAEQDQPQPPLYTNPVTGKINTTGGDLLLVKGLLDVYLELSSSELNTIDFSDAELNGNILRSPLPASFPIIGGFENYFVEFAFPYWESFPVEWQTPITINSIVIAGGIPAGIIYSVADDAFTASVNVTYNATLSFSFGVVIKMTPFYTKTIPLVQLQTFVGNLLVDTAITGLIQRLNKKIVIITNSIRDVHETLEENRIIGTRYSSVDAARMQEIVIKADMLVSESINPEKLVTDLYLNIDKFLSPLPASFSEDELLTLGLTTEDIYNGPLLNNGFLLDNSLIPRKGDEELFASDIIHAMLGDDNSFSTSGFKMLSFAFSSFLNNYILTGPSSNSLILPTTDRYRPRLSIVKSNIRLFREGTVKEIVYDKNKVVTDFIAQSARNIKRISLHHDKNVIFDDPGFVAPENEYYSIQNDFPITYGIGKGTLSLSATPDRVAMSRQLKSYLLFFEQILADEDNQVNRMPDILSLDPDLDAVLPAQPLYTVPDVAPLLVSFLSSGLSFEDFVDDPANNYVTSIRNAAESAAMFFQRRNRYLDHLLARFGEDMSSYTELMLAKKFTDPAQVIVSHTTPEWKVLQDKIRLLSEVGTLEGDRNLGPDFTKFILFRQVIPGQWRWEIIDPADNTALLTGNNFFATPLASFNELFSLLSVIGKKACYVISAAAPFQVSLRVNPPAGSASAVSPITFATLPLAQARVDRIVELCGIIWNSKNVSGLEKKVARQIGFPFYDLRNLVNLSIDDVFVFGFDGAQFNFSATIDGFDNPLRSNVTFLLLATARTVAGNVIVASTNPANYSAVSTATTVTIRISDISGIIARIDVDKVPGLNIPKLIDDLVVFFNRKFGSQEGFYLIEHISLLPQTTTATGILDNTIFLSNPYLYQLSIVIPDGTDAGLIAPPLANRLVDGDFRILIEKQFQKECPAHIFPFFIYPGEGITSFQNLFKRWRVWKHVINDDLANLEPIQSNLIQFLNLSKPKFPLFIN